MATIKRGVVAAAIHADMCDDNDNGYSQDPRWGEDGKGVKVVTIGGYQYRYDRGSYDCASSCIEAWKAALEGTKYANALDGATYTGNMRSVFVNSGLFAWKPASFTACPGDLYLDEENHVAMCQSQVPDMLSEFSQNEHHGITGGKVGDQTGWEAYVHAYYNGHWDGILHYNGKADSNTSNTTKPSKPQTGAAPKFRLSTDQKGKTWLSEGVQGAGNAPLRFIAIDGVGRYRVCTEESGWLPWVTGYNVKDLDKGCAGDGSPIIGVQVESSKYRYAVRTARGWYSDLIGLKDTGKSNDNFAGDLANPVLGFRISRA